MAQTISGGLLTIVCSMEQIIAKLGVEQAGEQVLFLESKLFAVHLFSAEYF